MPLPFDPVAPDMNALALPPGNDHLFSTDLNKFDVYSRTVATTSKDLPLALISTNISLLIKITLKLLISTKNTINERVMHELNTLQTFPLLLLSIAIVTLADNRMKDIILAIALISVPRFIRLIRNEAMVLRKTHFIEAAITIGCSPTRVLGRHILPNVAKMILIECSITAANAIIVITSLNFLNIGFEPPAPT